MTVQIVQNRLDRLYDCRSQTDEDQAIREITQEIVLAALGRTDFFREASFQGGTCLRVFHSLPRFSEDLDFALIQPDNRFDLTPYLQTVTRELTAYGYAFEIDDRSKAGLAVQKAFLKDDSVGKLLRLDYRPRTGPMRKLRVKLEVDTNPPEGAQYEVRTLDFPFPSPVRVHDLPSLFAGKLHALLCREYMKGRDWYDFIWYTANRTPVNYELLHTSLMQTGPWQGQALDVDSEWCVTALRTIVETIDWKRAAADVMPFIKPNEQPSLEFWSKELFLTQSAKMAE